MNQLRQQQLQEAMGQRGLGINELNALMQGGQVGMPQFGNYTTAGQGQAPDLMSAAQNQYQGAMNQFTQGQANQGNLWGTVGSIAGSIFGL